MISVRRLSRAFSIAGYMGRWQFNTVMTDDEHGSKLQRYYAAIKDIDNSYRYTRQQVRTLATVTEILGSRKRHRQQLQRYWAAGKDINNSYRDTRQQFRT